MSKCEFCGKEMLEAKGCKKIPIAWGGNSYSPIRATTSDALLKEGRCHDCNAAPGYYHHPGCDRERCPICGLQLITCEHGPQEDRF